MSLRGRSGGDRIVFCLDEVTTHLDYETVWVRCGMRWLGGRGPSWLLAMIGGLFVGLLRVSLTVVRMRGRC